MCYHGGMTSDHEHVTVHISSGTILKVLLFLVVFALVFYLRDVVLILFTAIVIASALEPLLNWFGQRRIPRLLATVIVYVIIIALIGLFIFFILPPLLSDVADFVGTLPKYVDVKYIGGTSTYVGVKNALQNISNGASLAEVVSTIGNALASGQAFIFQTATTIFGGALSFVLVIVLSFYLCAQRDGVEQFLRLLTPKHQEAYVIGLWKRSQSKIGKWMQGQMALAVLVGLMVFIGLSLLGIRHALILAFLSGIFEIIPVFGPILGAVPGIAVSILDGGLALGLIVAALYTLIQQLESNVIYPLVVKKIIGIPPLVVILSLVVGYNLAGILGVLLAVPLATALIEYLNDVSRGKVSEEKHDLMN